MIGTARHNHSGPAPATAAPGATSAPADGGVWNLPNAITFARLCAVPFAAWLALRQHLASTCVLFAAAGASDAVDGWIARRRGGSALGAMLDPLADKALLVSMFLTLGYIGVLPAWLVVLAVVRDVVILAGLLAMWIVGRTVRFRPLAISKLNTALQLGLIAATLLYTGFGIGWTPLLVVLVWAVAATTIVSGALYVWKGFRSTLP